MSGQQDLVCGALVLHLESQLVSVAASVALAASVQTMLLKGHELTVLEQLMRSKGRIVSKDTLLLRMYSERNRDECEYSQSVLTIVVMRLRRKLAELGWAGTIESVWGTGYTMPDTSNAIVRAFTPAQWAAFERVLDLAEAVDPAPVALLRAAPVAA